VKLRLLPLLALVALWPLSIFASTAEAETFLKKAVTEIVAIAKNSPNSAALATNVRPVLLNIINFEAMTRRAVGPGWRQFTDDQQKEATGLFTTLIIRTYSSKFTPGELPDVTYKPATSPEPGRVEVPTTTLYKGSRYEVIYRQEAAEKWRITDVVIEGVSMVANYRTQFDAEFKSGGANAVINALKKSVASSK
jgi:phospholipid transport system substrate-binding protein